MEAKLEKLVLGIDAGHGMGNVSANRFDPGATAAGLTEADIALQWALTGKYIAREVFKLRADQVFLTRDDNSDVAPVGNRATRFKQAGATHVVSLHCNASANPLASGTETLYPVIGPGRGDLDDYRWAELVQAKAVAAIGRPSRGLKAENQSQHSRLAVFNAASAGMSICLLETGFITNPTDRRKLTSRDVRVWFWTGLLRGLGFREGGW